MGQVCRIVTRTRCQEHNARRDRYRMPAAFACVGVDASPVRRVRQWTHLTAWAGGHHQPCGLVGITNRAGWWASPTRRQIQIQMRRRFQSQTHREFAML